MSGGWGHPMSSNAKGAGILTGGYGLTSLREVVRRLRSGERLTLTWGPVLQSIFPDGTLVMHHIMEKLVERRIAKPMGSTVGSPWKLVRRHK